MINTDVEGETSVNILMYRRFGCARKEVEMQPRCKRKTFSSVAPNHIIIMSRVVRRSGNLLAGPTAR